MNDKTANPHVYYGKGWLTKRMNPKQYKSWLDVSQVITAFAFLILILFYLGKIVSVGVNRSESVKGSFFVANKLEREIKRGDLVTFNYYGEHYPHGTMFTKFVAGVPGDVVTSDNNRNFYVNGQFVGRAKELSRSFEPLEPNSFRGVIPYGKFWYFTEHPDSFDSRYSLAGFGDTQDIVGKTYILF